MCKIFFYGLLFLALGLVGRMPAVAASYGHETDSLKPQPPATRAVFNMFAPVGKRAARFQLQNDEEEFKPYVNVGGFLQTHFRSSESRTDDRWSREMYVYRSRILLGGAISKKTSFFTQTEISSLPGRSTGNAAQTKTVEVAPRILDAQVEHWFVEDKLQLIAGMQLVGISRNQLQSPVTLMGLDFGYYTYAHNLFEAGATSALQNYFGRDIGVNMRGFLANSKLEWRAGVFRGRIFDPYSPLRTVVRLNYNFFESETFLYYVGTELSGKKILSVGGGVETQSTYTSYAAEVFANWPISEQSVFTGTISYQNWNGGTDFNNPYSFHELLARQGVLYTEFGVYFKKPRLQPYVKYESQRFDAQAGQGNVQATNLLLSATATASDIEQFNTLNSQERLAVGLGYYFADLGSHVKLQYERIGLGTLQAGGTAQTVQAGEITLQLTYFIFQ